MVEKLKNQKTGVHGNEKKNDTRYKNSIEG